MKELTLKQFKQWNNKKEAPIELVETASFGGFKISCRCGGTTKISLNDLKGKMGEWNIPTIWLKGNECFAVCFSCKKEVKL